MTASSRVLGITFAILCAALPARGETITITSGALVWTESSGQPPAITLAGEGFTFEGAGLGGIFQPRLQCIVPECTVGTTVDLHTVFLDADLPGTATLNGRSYSPVGGLAADATAAAEWTGALTIPTGFTGGLLTAPFLFSGLFFHQDDPALGFRRIDLAGSGVASLTFVRSPFPNSPGAFALESVRYDFQTDPVPEPTSILLIGSGLAGLAALRRRRAGELPE